MEAQEDLCAFCLDRIQNPKKLHCNHAFCQACLEIYLEARSWVAERCPICRRSLVEQGNEVSESGQVAYHTEDILVNIPWRLFGLVMLAMLLLSVGSFYLLLLYW